MTDIVERLRGVVVDGRPRMNVEAADEIERLLASRCQCDDECALSIENERLRAQWRDSDPEKLFAENRSLRAEIEWLKTWKAEAIAWHDGQRAEIERLRARIKELETIFLPDRLTGGP